VQHRRPRAGAFCSSSPRLISPRPNAGQHRQMEVNMRRFLWATPLLIVLISSGAWADSVNIFLSPNDGSGDNFGIEQQSRGMTVFLGGGTPFDFFNILGYEPGSTLGGDTTVYLDFGTAQIGGVNYDLDITTTGDLFMSGITLPTNGAFTVTDPVVLSFTGSATIADTGQIINVSGSSTGKITFQEYGGLYYAGAFTTTPEPGTVGLIGTGLIGIFSVARRRLRISTPLGPTRILPSAVLRIDTRSSEG
jgi:hypothetical protein